MPKLRISIGEIISCVKTSVNEHRIFDYSNDILAHLIGWRSGQLLGWSALGPALLRVIYDKSLHPRSPTRCVPFNTLRTKRNSFYLKTQFEPRSKHHLGYKHQSLNAA
jgi:hypothetical protein